MIKSITYFLIIFFIFSSFNPKYLKLAKMCSSVLHLNSSYTKVNPVHSKGNPLAALLLLLLYGHHDSVVRELT